MTTFTFPPTLVPLKSSLRLWNPTRGMVRSLNGFTQVSSSVSQRWRLRVEFPILTRDRLKAFRAIKASLRGRENHLRIMVPDHKLWPSNNVLGLSEDNAVLYSDGSNFSDGTKFSTLDLSSVTASGTKGDGTVDIDFGSYGEILEAGQYIGIDDELYIATNVVYVGSVATVAIEPGLRKTYSSALVTLRPYLTCRLLDDESGEHDMDLLLKAKPTLDLEEVVS